MPDDPPSAVSRRTLLAVGGSGLAAVLAGCARPDALGGGPRAASAPGSPDPSEEPETAPDVVTAEQALTEIRAVRDLVQDVVARFPGLAASLTPVVAMHAAHDLALAGAVPTAPTPSASTPDDDTDAPEARPRALRAALAAEETLRDDLAGLALRAESGAFAQLLASMSAAVAQRAARWPS